MMNIETTNITFRKSEFSWVAIVAGIVLLIPLVAVQFTDEVDWDLIDFIVMGFLLSSMGRLFVVVSRRTNRKNRVIIGILLAISFLFIWTGLAVGVFTGLKS